MSVAALAGQKLAGLYHLKTVVAHGAHGVVFEAQHVFHGTRHAVKVFYPEAAESGALARCRRDADMAAALHDPGIVRVAEWSRPELLPTAYLVMDFVEGENVQSRVRRLGRLTPQAVLDLGLRVGQALAAAHKLGVVHRGLTPRNLLYVPAAGASTSSVPASSRSASSFPASARSASSVPASASSASTRSALASFASARAAAASSVSSGSGGAAEDIQILDFGVAHLPARPDLLLMQAPYLAPEVLRGEDGDQRSDQYSLAAVLYEALTGRTPSQHAPLPEADGVEQIELLPHDHDEDVPPLLVLCPEAPPHLAAAIERAMSPSQGKRYASMGDFTRALDDRGPIPWYRAASVASSVLSARSALSQGSAGGLSGASQGSAGRSGGSIGQGLGRSGRSGEPGGGTSGRSSGGGAGPAGGPSGRSVGSGGSSISAQRLRLLEEGREAQARSQASTRSPGAGSEVVAQALASASAKTSGRTPIDSGQTPSRAASGQTPSRTSATAVTSGQTSNLSSGPTTAAQVPSKTSEQLLSKTSGQVPSKTSGQVPSRASTSNPPRPTSGAAPMGAAIEPAPGAAARASEASSRGQGRPYGAPQRTDSVHSLSPVTVNGQQRRGRRAWGVALGSCLVLAGLIYVVRVPHSASSSGMSEQRALRAQGRAAQQPATRAQEPATQQQPVDPALRLLDAQAALGRGEHSRAIELAKGALPSPQAWQVIALAACQMGDQGLMDEALQQLGPAEQARVRLDCIRQ